MLILQNKGPELEIQLHLIPGSRLWLYIRFRGAFECTGPTPDQSDLFMARHVVALSSPGDYNAQPGLRTFALAFCYIIVIGDWQ